MGKKTTAGRKKPATSDPPIQNGSPLLICGVVIAAGLLAAIFYAIATRDKSSSGRRGGVVLKNKGIVAPNGKVTVITYSADSFCGFCKKMDGQKEEVGKRLAAKGYEYKLLSDTKMGKEAFKAAVAKSPKTPRGYPATDVFVGNKHMGQISGYRPAEAFAAEVEKTIAGGS